MMFNFLTHSKNYIETEGPFEISHSNNCRHTIIFSVMKSKKCAEKDKSKQIEAGFGPFFIAQYATTKKFCSIDPQRLSKAGFRSY